tara:strand:- start:16802 stop:17359 length:558 start_codon:yes stop_codon:yes gene_type:complete
MVKDAVLVEQAQAGESQALSVLIDRYHGRLVQALHRWIYNEADIIDVLQDTYIRAYRAVQKFRGDSQFYTWLYRIAINVAKDFLLKLKVSFDVVEIEQSYQEPQQALSPLHDISDPESILIGRQAQSEMDGLLQAMPADLSKTFILREHAGYSYDAIAKEMDCPIGTVRSRLSRAREALEQRLMT